MKTKPASNTPCRVSGSQHYPASWAAHALLAGGPLHNKQWGAKKTLKRYPWSCSPPHFTVTFAKSQSHAQIFARSIQLLYKLHLTRLRKAVPLHHIAVGWNLWMGCSATSQEGPGGTTAQQPGTTEWKREMIPTHLSFHGGLKNGKRINRTLINHTTVFRKHWKVKKFSQQG